MRFSRRTAWDVEETRLARALRERRELGLEVLDLTASNPTRCGLRYDEAGILAALADEDALRYDPDPRGMLRAREAVCRYYAERGANPGPERIFLTTSTSEAYSWVFRLLCDPGEEVLIAQPSYPLFDFLAQIEDVRLVPFPLVYDHGWQIDLPSLRARVTERTRAIAVVHPNNPTGHFTKAEERRALEALCAERGLALVVDEVFLDFGLEATHPVAKSGDKDGAPGSPHKPTAGLNGAPRFSAESFVAGPHPCLTFVLSGISKIAALPQMKAAWVCVCGPAAGGPDGELHEALERLEVVADTFLSMNAPVQCALPSWLDGAGAMQEQIRRRTAANLRALDALLADASSVTRLDVEAGWYAVLRVPALGSDEDLAVRLVEERGVSVHPGYFFGFPGEGWLVISLLPEEEEFRRGLEAVCGEFRTDRG